MKYVKLVSENEVEHLVKQAYSCQLSLKGVYELYALYVNKIPVSIGAIQYKKGKAILKFEFTPVEFRGNGYHEILLKYRIEIIKSKNIKSIEVYCLKPSLKNHVKAGAKIIKEFKHGGAFVKYESV